MQIHCTKYLQYILQTYCLIGLSYIFFIWNRQYIANILYNIFAIYITNILSNIFAMYIIWRRQYKIFYIAKIFAYLQIYCRIGLSLIIFLFETDNILQIYCPMYLQYILFWCRQYIFIKYFILQTIFANRYCKYLVG